MKLAIMQPYFLPYIGYFQLMQAVDEFVVYDEIKYTKKGWINRNRFLLNGRDEVFSLPLAKSPDWHTVAQRELAAEFDRRKLLARWHAAYRRAPHFDLTYSLLERVLSSEDDNLFRFILHSLQELRSHLSITSRIRISSSLPFDNQLKGQDKVLAICACTDATRYINSIGGAELYDRDAFASRAVQLQFIRSRPFEYAQFGNTFVPWLSIVDVLMFNPLDQVRALVQQHYDLV